MEQEGRPTWREETVKTVGFSTTPVTPGRFDCTRWRHIEVDEAAYIHIAQRVDAEEKKTSFHDFRPLAGERYV
jgi:hypothetical protein